MGAAVAVALLLVAAYAAWPRPAAPRSRRALGRAADRVESVAGALESIALCLQAGLTPVQAVSIALEQLPGDSLGSFEDSTGIADGNDSPASAGVAVDDRGLIRDVLLEVRRALARGAPGGPAWTRHTAQVPELRLVAGAWTLTEASGSALHPAVMWAVGQLREKRAARERLAAVTAGATSSMGMMLILPLSGMPIGLLVGVTPRELYGSWTTFLCCVVGLGLAALGVVFSRRALRKALAPKKIASVPGEADATMDDLADAALMLQLALSSGAGIIESLEQVAEVSPPRVRAELRRVVAAYRWGLGHERAWTYADPAWEPVSAALALALQHGAAPAASVKAAAERLASTEKSRLAAAAGKAETFLMIPLVVFFLPAFALTTVLPLVVALVPSSLF